MKLNVRIIFALLLLSLTSGAQDTLSSIRFDQEGFYPNGPKIALLTTSDLHAGGFPTGKTAFYIYQENQSAPVFKGELSDIMHSSNSSSVTRIADFSALSATGSFH